MADPWDKWTVVDEATPSPQSQASTSGTSLPLIAASKAVPATATLAVEAATNPHVPKIMSTVGQIVGGVEGLRREGPLGAAAGAWTGWKAGYFTGKLAQRLGVPVATLMDRAAPYAQSLATLGGAAGVGDLAQMAEPQRKDIGFLGIGSSVDIPKEKLDAIYVSGIEHGISNGETPSTAAAKLANGDPKVFGAAMTAYMKSRMAK